MERLQIFADMDGVLARWQEADIEEVASAGYFLNLLPDPNIIQAIRKLSLKHDIYIASKVLNPLAASEKSEWLTRYLPEIPKENEFFISYNANGKAEGIPIGIMPYAILLDDNNKHGLKDWPGIGVKVLNGINNTRRTWKGYIVSNQQDPQIIADTVEMIGLTAKKKFDSKKISV